jgi:hypothetical protein
MSVELMKRPQSVHPENLPEPATDKSLRPPSLRMIATGIVCGLVGATLAAGAFSSGFWSHDAAGVFSVLPLIVTLIAVVCSLVAAISDMMAD